MNWWAWKDLGGYQQAFLFGLATLAALPNISDSSEKVPTYVSEALHFRRGIRERISLTCLTLPDPIVENFRVWDTEWEIPIPALKTGKRDYELVQRAWCVVFVVGAKMVLTLFVGGTESLPYTAVQMLQSV